MQHLSVNQYLRDHIRTVPDWPAPGVQFRDITPLLQDAKVFRVLIDAFVHRYMDANVRPDVVAGLDARGFIVGAVVAYELNVGFVPIRKKGKLPFTTVEETYELEYGSATVELHTDAVRSGNRVVLIDDLIATGGTIWPPLGDLLLPIVQVPVGLVNVAVGGTAGGTTRRPVTGTVLVVSHGGTMRAVLDHLAVEHAPIGNCAVIRVNC